MAQLKALIFDVDGTLADTERDGHRVAFNLAFQEAKLDWDWSVAQYGELLSVTGGKERIRYYLEKYRTDFTLSGDLTQFIADLHVSKTTYYKKLMVDPGLPLRPGVVRLLQEARQQGMRLAISTTTTPANVTALLTNSLAEDAEDWFEVIAAGDIVPAKKPAPDIYIWAMEQLQLQPEECLAFEDSDNGVKSVIASGIRSLVVTVNGYTKDQNLQGSSVILDHLGDPENPCQRLQGSDLIDQMVDMDSLQRLHDHVWG